MDDKIIMRYNHARTYTPDGFNCIGFAFYACGLDKKEIFREPGYIESYSGRIVREGTLNEAVLVGIEGRTDPGYVKHLMVRHPSEMDLLLHRPGADEVITTASLDEVLRNFKDDPSYCCRFFSVRNSFMQALFKRLRIRLTPAPYPPSSQSP